MDCRCWVIREFTIKWIVVHCFCWHRFLGHNWKKLDVSKITVGKFSQITPKKQLHWFYTLQWNCIFWNENTIKCLRLDVWLTIGSVDWWTENGDAFSCIAKNHTLNPFEHAHAHIHTNRPNMLHVQQTHNQMMTTQIILLFIYFIFFDEQSVWFSFLFMMFLTCYRSKKQAFVSFTFFPESLYRLHSFIFGYLGCVFFSQWTFCV